MPAPRPFGPFTIAPAAGGHWRWEVRAADGATRHAGAARNRAQAAAFVIRALVREQAPKAA